MTDAQRVLILGHGAMGSVFETLLADHDLVIWERDPDSGEESCPLETAGRDRQVVLFALPAFPHRELAERLAGQLPEDAVCLSIAKGLDADGRTPAQVFEGVFDDRLAWGMICGPMIARDLQSGRAGFAALASGSERGRKAAGLFARTRLYLDPIEDVHGAAWSVILKNVFVPMVGAADSLEMGDNMRGFLLAEALAELARIVEDRGGRRATAYGPAGLGDLATTATSESSHHRGLGARLAGGEHDRLDEEGEYIRSEGLHAVQRVREFRLLPRGRYPLFDLATDFLDGAVTLREGLDRYLGDRFGRPIGS
ncbi:MAG: hypothetical protein HND55_08275 [Pseudomonadota bacterium]|nr:MAG: hypothetical protein HND55_08275 [Pseudomonadota bacterium]